MKQLLFSLCLVLSVLLGNSLSAQSTIKDRIARIDSIVNSSNTYGALEEIVPLYLEYKERDSTSIVFQKLSREYLFILEKSELNLQAIELASSILNRQQRNKKTNAEVLIVLARLHEKVGNKELCLSRLDEVRALLPHANSDSLELIWRIRMSSYHRIYSSKDSARYFAQLAFDQAELINQPLHKATASFLLAFLSDNPNDRLDYLTYSKNIFQRNTDISGTAAMCFGLRKVYLELGDTTKANFYLDSVGSFVCNTPYIQARLSYYNELTSRYRIEKKFDSALTYYDSVTVISKRIEEKQDKVELLSKDLWLSNEQLKNDVERGERKNNLLFFFGSIVTVLLIIIALMAHDQFKKRKIITFHKKLLKIRNTELITSLNKNENLLMELNHRVKNSLATLSGLLQIQVTKTDSEKVKVQLSASIDRINTLSEIYKRTLEDVNLELSDNVELIESICKAQFELSGRDSELLILDVQSIKLKNSQVTPLVLSINELLTNAIKYSTKNSKVTVSLHANGNNVVCSVSNVGEGLSENYRIDNNKSVGLYIVKLFVNQLNGKLLWLKDKEVFKIFFHFNL